MVGQRVHPADSTGWTAIVLERASRFLVEQQCGCKDAILFKKLSIPHILIPRIAARI